MNKIAASYKKSRVWLRDTWESPHAKYIFPFILLFLSFITAIILSNGTFGARLTNSFEWMVKYGSPLCLSAIGASLVLATGGVDISSSGVATMGGVIMAIFLNLFPGHYEIFHFSYTLGFVLGLPCVIFFGYLSGKLLGYSITKSNSPPLIYSWALGIVWFALAVFLSSSIKGRVPLYNSPSHEKIAIIKLPISNKDNSEHSIVYVDSLKYAKKDSVKSTISDSLVNFPIINKSAMDSSKINGTIADSGGISVNGLQLSDNNGLYLLIMILAFSQILWYTGLPRKSCAIGANKDSATYAGISVNKTTISCYIWSAIFSALAGVLILYQTSKASTSGLAGKEIISIAVAVIGGTVMSGGYLNIFSVIAAAFFYSNFQKITTGMSFANMPQQQQLIDTIFALTFIILIMIFGKKINGITQTIQVDRNTKQQ